MPGLSGSIPSRATQGCCRFRKPPAVHGWYSQSPPPSVALGCASAHVKHGLVVQGPAGMCCQSTTQHNLCPHNHLLPLLKHWSVINTLYQHGASSSTVAVVHGDILLNRKMNHVTVAQRDHKRVLVLGKKLSLRFPPLLTSVVHA